MNYLVQASIASLYDRNLAKHDLLGKLFADLKAFIQLLLMCLDFSLTLFFYQLKTYLF